MNYEHYPVDDGPGCAVGCVFLLFILLIAGLVLGLARKVWEVLAPYVDPGAVVLIVALSIVVWAIWRTVSGRGGNYTNKYP